MSYLAQGRFVAVAFIASAHTRAVDIPATDTTIVGSASVDVTMPYIQLLVCKKD